MKQEATTHARVFV